MGKNGCAFSGFHSYFIKIHKVCFATCRCLAVQSWCFIRLAIRSQWKDETSGSSHKNLNANSSHTKVFEPLLQWKFAGPGTTTTRQGWIMCPKSLPRIAPLAALRVQSSSSQQALLLRAVQGLCLFAKPPSLPFESLPNIFKHRNSECSATSKVPSTPQNYSSQAHHMSQAQKIPVIAVD